MSYLEYADYMPIEKSRNISLLRVLGIFSLGLVSGIQLALYLFDCYDDGIADARSLLVGICMVLASVGFILFSFAKGETRQA